MTSVVIIICVVVLLGAVCVAYMSQQKKLINAALATQEEHHRRELEMTRQSNESQNRQLLAEVKALTRELAAEQAARLRDENGREMRSVVEPLRQHLDSFRRQIDAGNDRENQARAHLQGQIEQLIALNRSLGDDTRELTQALRGGSRSQGDWGETQLVTLLEQAGLQPDVHFSTQVTRGADGRLLRDPDTDALRRPDVVISLPGNKKLVVDSKVSLTAYLDYTNATDKKIRQEAAKRHLVSVKQHIGELERKKYPSLIEGAGDQTLMFMPVEGAFVLALHTDPGLLRYACERKVVIVTPVHLMSVVQLAAQLWRRDDSERNAREIAKAAGSLYDKLCGFCDDFDKVRRSLDTASAAWDAAQRKLSTGRGCAISQAEKMKALGADTSKRLPFEASEND